MEDQQRHKLDVIAPRPPCACVKATCTSRAMESLITEDGVTEVDGIYRPTAVADEGIADKAPQSARLPAPHAHRQCPASGRERERVASPEPERRFMLRAFRGEGGPGRPAEGVARALLSDSYKLMDNFDLLLAALDGVKQSGHPTRVTGCDLTDRRMYVRVESEAVAVHARELLRGYRSPVRRPQR
ncbi:hypothetical protein LV779_22070 [Streptomyces thinghirensis]|nr:hypothetical protein [Streptomyces thinghirensis]